jgi:hypothetical protein
MPEGAKPNVRQAGNCSQFTLALTLLLEVFRPSLACRAGEYVCEAGDRVYGADDHACQADDHASWQSG